MAILLNHEATYHDPLLPFESALGLFLWLASGVATAAEGLGGDGLRADRRLVGLSGRQA